MSKSFQLTTSHGGRLHKRRTAVLVWNLSTHDLTRRSTIFLPNLYSPLILSTHDLTRRSTEILPNDTVEMNVFQLTTSHGGRLHIVFTTSPKFSFQLTTSHGGRPYLLPFPRKSVCLSTHDLTRRSTTDITLELTGETFQLTTSHGGRLHPSCSSRSRLSFNSRPHTEVDLHHMSVRFLHRLSTHDLTRRSTFCHRFHRFRLDPFNSRPHTEVDMILSAILSA